MLSRLLGYVIWRNVRCFIIIYIPWAIVVSYCGQWLSVVRRRPSSVNIWCLDSRDQICDTIFMKLDQNVCFDNI